MHRRNKHSTELKLLIGGDNTMFTEFSLALLVIVALVVFAWIIRLIQQWQWKTSIIKIIIGQTNSAAGIEYAGYFLGVWIITSSVLNGASLQNNQVFILLENGSLSIWSYAFQIALYGISSILLLALLGHFGLRLILRINLKEIIRSNNSAAGIVIASGYISTALIIAGVLSGESDGGDIIVTLVFALSGIISLLLFTYLFRFLTSYSDTKEIRDDNNAAALSYGGIMIALGMIIGHALEGNFINYTTSFILYGKSLLVILLLYPIRQIIVQGILLGDGYRFYGGKLDEEISVVHNLGAGSVEAATYLAFAILAIHLGY